MGWGDVRYCFAMAILVIIPLLLSFFLSFFGQKFCPTHCSATIERKSMKLHRNVKHYEQMSKNDHSRLLAEQKLMKLAMNNIHIQWNEISQKNRNRLNKLFRNCHGNKKGRIKKKLGFLSLNFIKLCRNIQRSVWQLLEFEQIQNDGRCHGNQGATNVKFKRTADPFENWHKNRSPLKVVLFVFKIFKMATNIKIKTNR